MDTQKKGNMAKRLISCATVFSFLISQVAYAVPQMGIEFSVPKETPSFLQISIPANLATVDDLYEAPFQEHPKLVLHIQNAHANYDAQQKIKQLLVYLNKTYSIKTIFVEGATQPLDPGYLKFFPDRERNLEFAEDLAKKGELTGAELYAIEADGQGARAEGIEDPAVYKANYDALKKVLGSESTVKRFLNGYTSRLEALSSKVFTQEMRSLLSEWQKFEKGHREFIPFVKNLSDAALRVLGIDLNSLFSQVEWPQMTRLLVLQGMEKDLDMPAVYDEKEKLIAFLQSKKLAPELIAAVKDFKDQQVTLKQKSGASNGQTSHPRFLFERLVEEAGPKGFAFHDYPSFSLYAGYLILKAEMDSTALFEEISLLFAKTFDRLAKGAHQKQLLGLYRDQILVRKLLSLELTRKDWRSLDQRKENVSMESLVERLRELGKAVNVDFKMADTDFETRKLNPKFRDEVTSIYDAGYRFYDFAHQREQIFYDKMSAAMEKSSAQGAVLITGGFHTEGITELLREHEVNYAVLTPRLMEKSDEGLYKRSMLQDRMELFSISFLEAAAKLASLRGLQAQGVEFSKTLATELEAFRSVGNFRTVDEAVTVFNGSEAAKLWDIQLKKTGSNAYRIEKNSAARSDARSELRGKETKVVPSSDEMEVFRPQMDATGRVFNNAAMRGMLFGLSGVSARIASASLWFLHRVLTRFNYLSEVIASTTLLLPYAARRIVGRSELATSTAILMRDVVRRISGRSEARRVVVVTDAEFAELEARLKSDTLKSLDTVSAIILGWSYGDVDGYKGVKSLYHSGLHVRQMSRGPNQSYPDDHIVVGFGGLVAQLNEENLKDSDGVLATLKAGIKNFNAKPSVRSEARGKISFTQIVFSVGGVGLLMGITAFTLMALTRSALPLFLGVSSADGFVLESAPMLEIATKIRLQSIENMILQTTILGGVIAQVMVGIIFALRGNVLSATKHVIRDVQVDDSSKKLDRGSEPEGRTHRSEARRVVEVTEAEFAELEGRLKADTIKSMDSVSAIILGWSYGDVDGYKGVKSLYHSGLNVRQMSRGPNQSYPNDHIVVGFGGLVAQLNEEDLKDSDGVLAKLKAGIRNYNAASSVRSESRWGDPLTAGLVDFHTSGALSSATAFMDRVAAANAAAAHRALEPSFSHAMTRVLTDAEAWDVAQWLVRLGKMDHYTPTLADWRKTLNGQYLPGSVDKIMGFLTIRYGKDGTFDARQIEFNPGMEKRPARSETRIKVPVSEAGVFYVTLARPVVRPEVVENISLSSVYVLSLSHEWDAGKRDGVIASVSYPRGAEKNLMGYGWDDATKRTVLVFKDGTDVSQFPIELKGSPAVSAILNLTETEAQAREAELKVFNIQREIETVASSVGVIPQMSSETADEVPAAVLQDRATQAFLDAADASMALRGAETYNGFDSVAAIAGTIAAHAARGESWFFNGRTNMAEEMDPTRSEARAEIKALVEQIVKALSRLKNQVSVPADHVTQVSEADEVFRQDPVMWLAYYYGFSKDTTREVGTPKSGTEIRDEAMAAARLLLGKELKRLRPDLASQRDVNAVMAQIKIDLGELHWDSDPKEMGANAEFTPVFTVRSETREEDVVSMGTAALDTEKRQAFLDFNGIKNDGRGHPDQGQLYDVPGVGLIHDADAPVRDEELIWQMLRSETREWVDPRLLEYSWEAEQRIDRVGQQFGRSLFDHARPGTDAMATVEALDRIAREDGEVDSGWEVVNGRVQRVDMTRSESRTGTFADPRYLDLYTAAADRMDGVGTQFGRSMFDIESPSTQAHAAAEALNAMAAADDAPGFGWEVVNGRLQEVDPLRSELRTEVAAQTPVRAEVRIPAIAEEQLEDILSPADLDLVIKTRLGQDADVIRRVEENPELMQRVQVVIAAVSGKIAPQSKELLSIAEILKAIANESETPLAAFIAKIKSLLDIKDGAGLMAEMMPAGTGVTAEDRVGDRAILMNSMQRVTKLWVTDAANKASFEVQAKAIVAEESKWFAAQGVDLAGRFEIKVIDAAKALAELKSFANEKYALMKLVARDSGFQLDPMSFFVLTGTKEMLDLVDSETLRAAMVEREDYESAKIRGVARIFTAGLSQDVANKADLLNERTRQILEQKGSRYHLNPQGLAALAAQLWTEVMAAFSLAKSA